MKLKLSILFIVVAGVALSLTAKKTDTIASWYDVEGQVCASRDYPIGEWLRVSSGRTWENVQVIERGPSLELYNQGRHLDLSKTAFAKLSDLRVGLIQVTVEDAGTVHPVDPDSTER